MKTSKQIRKEITQTESDLSTLQNKRDNTIEKLRKIKKDFTQIGSKESRDLQGDKSLLDEVIQEKQSLLESLQCELEKQIVYEKRQDTFHKLIQLSEQARKLETEHRKNFEKLNAYLKKAIPEILLLHRNWRNTALEFEQTAKRIDTPISELIRELEVTGATLDAVLSRMVVDGTQARGNRRIDGLKFGSGIYSILKNYEIEKNRKKAG